MWNHVAYKIEKSQYDCIKCKKQEQLFNKNGVVTVASNVPWLVKLEGELQ